MFAIVLLQLKKAQAEAADATTQLSAVEQALKTLEAGDMDAIKHQYVDAVRKMAVAQVRSLVLAAGCARAPGSLAGWSALHSESCKCESLPANRLGKMPMWSIPYNSLVQKVEVEQTQAQPPGGCTQGYLTVRIPPLRPFPFCS